MKKSKKRLTKHQKEVARKQAEIAKLESQLQELNTKKEIQLYLRAIHTDFDSMKHMTRVVKFYVEKLAVHLKVSLEPSTAEVLKVLDPAWKPEIKGDFVK